jgi:poly(3-hydroxybutyrate) depolymerase
MAVRENPCRPVTLTMMGGPIDTRESPTAVNDHAITKPFVWFKHNVITTVPANYPGAGRQVYPGFVQLASFMSMNLGSHMNAHYGLFKHLVQGDGESADATKTFYDEYRAVCDMTAEFYLPDHRRRVPAAPAAQGRTGPSRHPRRSRRDRGHRDPVHRGRARRHLGHRPDQGRAQGDAEPAGEATRSTTLRPKSATTASSTAPRWRTGIAPVVEGWIKSNTAARGSAW